MPVIEAEGWEADDVIGSLAKQATAEGFKTVIVSGDKDFYQLIDKDTALLNPGRGGQLARSAGTEIQLLGRDEGRAQLRLPSGETREVLIQCMATIGKVGNVEHANVVIGKAGRSRWLGRRPKVRGVVMNPVDHPHGGGEGKSSGGRHPVTPWGKPTKGYKTRKRKNQSNQWIIRRRNSK